MNNRACRVIFDDAWSKLLSGGEEGGDDDGLYQRRRRVVSLSFPFLLPRFGLGPSRVPSPRVEQVTNHGGTFLF